LINWSRAHSYQPPAADKKNLGRLNGGSSRD
jgi:hypothetical protein